MPVPTLVTTPGSASANAYISLADAETVMVDTRLHAGTTWTGASADDKGRAILWATRLIDLFYDFHGVASNSDQALSWPRYGTYDEDGDLIASDSIPAIISNATAEFAAALLKGDRFAERAVSGSTSPVVEAALGPMKVRYKESEVGSEPSLELLPQYIRVALARVGRMSAAALASMGGARSVNLRRS